MHINSTIPQYSQHVIIHAMTYANAQRPTQRLYACGTNPSIIIIISSLRNYWNHRSLLSVTPRRANDVPRCYHHYFRAYNVYGSLSVPHGTRSDRSHPTWAHGHMAHERYSMIHSESIVAHTPLGHTTFTTMQSDFTTYLNNATSISAYLNIATSAAFLNIVCKVHIMMHVIPNALMTNICTYI